jgi:hypothetical protein
MAKGRSRNSLNLHSQVSFNISALGNLNKAFYEYQYSCSTHMQLLYQSLPDIDRTLDYSEQWQSVHG